MATNQLDEIAERPITFIREHAKQYAEAKANRVKLEQLRKSKKALLIVHAPDECKTAQAKESWAYAHNEYINLLDDLRESVLVEEQLRLEVKAAEMQFEKWRTQQANLRAERGRYGA